jgi:hypothetical protein
MRRTLAALPWQGEAAAKRPEGAHAPLAEGSRQEQRARPDPRAPNPPSPPA